MQEGASLLAVHHQSVQDALALFGVSRAGLCEEDVLVRGASLARPTSCTVAIVRRQQHLRQVDAEGLVEGDIVLLRPGFSVFADGRLLLASDLHMNELQIFGNTDVHKQLAALLPETLPIDATNMVFAGSRVLSGTGEYVVTAPSDKSLCRKFNLCDVACEPVTDVCLEFVESSVSDRELLCLHATLGDELILNPHTGVFESIGGRYEKAIALFLQQHPMEIGLRVFHHPMDAERGVAIAVVEMVGGRTVLLAGEADVLLPLLDITDKERSQITRKLQDARKKHMLTLLLAETPGSEQAQTVDALGDLSYVGLVYFSAIKNKNS
ncbi:MAG: hypothetical protein WCT24_01705 [Patescibacteria group bacterium]